MALIEREYYPITEASGILGCQVRDLIHLGATGKLDIYLMLIDISLGIELTAYEDKEDILIDRERHYYTYTGLASLLNNDLKAIEIKPSHEIKAVSTLITKPDFIGAFALKYLDNFDSNLFCDCYISKVNYSFDRTELIVLEKDFNKIRDKFIKHSEVKSASIEKPLSTRTENNYLRLIMALANGIKDFNPTKPYAAAKLIIDETGIEKISLETIAGFISKAHALDGKEKD